MKWVIYVMFAALASAFAAIAAVGTGMVTDPALKQTLEGWSVAVIIATIFVGSLRAFAMALPENPSDPDDTP